MFEARDPAHSTEIVDALARTYTLAADLKAACLTERSIEPAHAHPPPLIGQGR